MKAKGLKSVEGRLKEVLKGKDIDLTATEQKELTGLLKEAYTIGCEEGSKNGEAKYLAGRPWLERTRTYLITCETDLNSNIEYEVHAKDEKDAIEVMRMAKWYPRLKRHGGFKVKSVERV